VTGTTLSAGTRLGPYEVVAPLGRGGMGEVYRGRDTRLGRDVAIKVLAASASHDPLALGRFRQEAQAASALNHPNIVTVYDVGTAGELPFLVTELLEGETLRHAMERRALTPERVLSLAAQAAAGLAAAHDKGIVHRDIKPENLFVTSSGVLKILDFGVSKLTGPRGSGDDAGVPATAPGLLMGTAGYVSPEQIRATGVDHRSDIFSLGVVLYEALTGHAPFRAASSAETLSAILNDHPPDPSQLSPRLTAAIDEVVRACLDKEPDRRFASAGDLAHTLRAIGALGRQPAPRRQRWRMPLMGAAATCAAFALSVVAAAFLMPPPGATADAIYRRITFARGTVGSARFRPGSEEVVYDGAMNGGARELFVTVPGTPEARALGLGNAELLAISRTGDLAVSLDRRLVRGYVGTGTLAVVTEGRAPREILHDVHYADWARDGTTLAVVRELGGRTRLEWPVHTVVYETTGWIGDVRFSPDGRRLALVDHPLHADDRGRVLVMEEDRTVRRLSRDWLSILGLAWSASGREVWVTAQDSAGVRGLRALDLSGRERFVAHAPGRLRLLDIRGDGQVLLARDDLRLEAHSLRAGDQRERNLSWLDWSLARDLSADGNRLLISEFGEAAGGAPSVYVRGTDGSPVVRLGPGSALAFSPDGRHVLAIWQGRLTLVPVGTGDVHPLPADGRSYHPYAGFFPDGQQIAFTASEPGRASRVYVQRTSGGSAVPITPEGFRLSSPASVSPGGDRIVVSGANEELFLADLAGPPRRVPGVLRGEEAARWDRGGTGLIVFARDRVPAQVFRVGLDGSRTHVRTLEPADLAGAITIHRLVMTPGGNGYAYTLERQVSDLYVVSGLHEPPRGVDLLRMLLRSRPGRSLLM
jgi:hypothetical protein